MAPTRIAVSISHMPIATLKHSTVRDFYLVTYGEYTNVAAYLVRFGADYKKIKKTFVPKLRFIVVKKTVFLSKNYVSSSIVLLLCPIVESLAVTRTLAVPYGRLCLQTCYLKNEAERRQT